MANGENVRRRRPVHSSGKFPVACQSVSRAGSWSAGVVLVHDNGGGRATILHVHAQNSRKIRHWQLYAPTKCAKIGRCRLFNQADPEECGRYPRSDGVFILDELEKGVMERHSGTVMTDSFSGVEGGPPRNGVPLAICSIYCPDFGQGGRANTCTRLSSFRTGKTLFPHLPCPVFGQQ